MKNTYKIQAKVWIYPGVAAWHFVSIPEDQAAQIKEIFFGMTRGFGSLPVVVTLGKTSWKTSIFPDKKTRTYLLPLKAEVRKKEKISEGDVVEFVVEVRP